MEGGRGDGDVIVVAGALVGVVAGGSEIVTVVRLTGCCCCFETEGDCLVSNGGV